MQKQIIEWLVLLHLDNKKGKGVKLLIGYLKKEWCVYIVALV